MDLESPLRTLASPIEAEVLRVLAGADAEFTAPQIHRLAVSGSPFGVRKALARLAEAGLVIAGRVGSTQTWKANRRHLLWPAIEAAVGARAQLFDLIEQRLKKQPEVDAYLYGSFARRESTPESDIDILLVFPNRAQPKHIADVAGDLSDDITEWTGNPAQMFSVTRRELADLARAGGPIVSSFRADAVPLAGPDFAELLSSIERSIDA